MKIKKKTVKSLIRRLLWKRMTRFLLNVHNICFMSKVFVCKTSNDRLSMLIHFLIRRFLRLSLFFLFIYDQSPSNNSMDNNDSFAIRNLLSWLKVNSYKKETIVVIFFVEYRLFRWIKQTKCIFYLVWWYFLIDVFTSHWNTVYTQWRRFNIFKWCNKNTMEKWCKHIIQSSLL